MILVPYHEAKKYIKEAFLIENEPTIAQQEALIPIFDSAALQMSIKVKLLWLIVTSGHFKIELDRRFRMATDV